jgi:threonine dehydrogenase-like Zn-dependent dehydrogenase
MEIGVPQDPLPFSGPECYAKNLRIQFGRCPARAVFQSALKMLVKIQDELADFVEVWEGLEDAPRAYELFDKGEVGKVVFQLSAREAHVA